jgi:hypothetical protein
VAQTPLVRLTSVYGTFRAAVMAARLEDEGLDVVMRGALGNPYGLTVGDMARVDLYVPGDQVDDAALVLLADEIDEADEVLDDDRPPLRDRVMPRSWAAAAALFVFASGPVALVARWY